MSSRKILLLIVTAAIWALSACNYTGECWRRGEESSGVGAGPGDWSGVGSSGSGDFGDDPGGQNDEEPLVCNKSEQKSKGESPKESSNSPQDPCPGVGDIAGDGATFLSCSDACSSKCPPPGMARVANFKPSDFPFVTTVEDDGQGDAGGYQEAKANLKFEYALLPTSIRGWYCPLTIKMPLRTELMGRIDPSRAASLSVKITTDVALDPKMDYKIPQGIFCKTFAAAADAAFKSKYQGLGASVTNP